MSVRGADLTAAPAQLTVILRRQGQSSQFVGAYGPVTVVDARGTLAGWTAYLCPENLPAASALVVEPGRPVAVSGNPGEVRRGRGLRAGRAAVMYAPAGGGGGTFETSGAIELTAPAQTGDLVTLELAVNAAGA